MRLRSELSVYRVLNFVHEKGSVLPPRPCPGLMIELNTGGRTSEAEQLLCIAATALRRKTR